MVTAVLTALAALTACNRNPAPDMAAAEAAADYYESLLKGDYSGFVAGMYLPEAIPDGYRSQLVDNAKMFVAEQRERHQGMVSVTALRQERDTIGTQPVAYALLLIAYADSTQEEIAVAMVDDDGQWMMR